MRILLLGAGGFIGRQIMAELLAGGHELVAAVRRVAGLDAAFPAVRFVALDLARATSPADWAPHLGGIELGEAPRRSRLKIRLSRRRRGIGVWQLRLSSRAFVDEVGRRNRKNRIATS